MTTENRVRPATDESVQAGPASPTEFNATFLDCETWLLGALLDAGPATVTKVLRWVDDTDLAGPFHRVILAAIRETALTGLSGSIAVHSRLLQTGVYGTDRGKLIQRLLVDAATCGAVGLSAYDCAATVVEAAHLRALAGLCEVGEAAAALSTRDRNSYVLRYVNSLNRLNSRLLELRQRSGGTDHA